MLLALCDMPRTPAFVAPVFLFHPWLGWLALAGGAACRGRPHLPAFPASAILGLAALLVLRDELSPGAITAARVADAHHTILHPP